MKRFFIIPVVLILGACSMFGNSRERLEITAVTKFPDLSDIQIAERPKLSPLQWDIPRDMTNIVVKNLTKCKNIPDDQKDSEFWNNCGEGAPLDNSNIYLGLNIEGKSKIDENRVLLREYIRRLELIIERTNIRYREWREINAKNLKDAESK